jgi:hypothetical protein
MASWERTRSDSADRGIEERRRQVEIVFIYSGTKGTLRTLRAATSLAKGLTANVRLPADDGLAIPTTIDLRICRDAREAMLSALRPHSNRRDGSAQHLQTATPRSSRRGQCS